MASSEAEFPGSRNTSSWEAFTTFMWDSNKNTFLGRNGKSWALITLFYVILYGCLAGFFLLSMYVFFQVGSDTIPTRTGYASPMKGNPGMGFRPQPDVVSNTIRFKQGVNESYFKYTQEITKFLDGYSDQKQKDNINCSDVDPDDRDKTKACLFDISVLGKDCPAPDYGFGEGQPCVLLKLNKVYGWEPEMASNDSSLARSEGAFFSDSIGITCEGAYSDDKEKVGLIEMYPKNGFPAHFYPYLNQEGYVSPVVFVRFTKPTTDVTVSVWCKAWAENIKHHRSDRAGSVIFNLHVE
ncbi:Sodium/potassium-transporting ATPase subunit beta [Lamellibrachia satsuma]|nr:Sodium/potassium-transporting ATPase subunit beta [Lamellibrachia satsuma]